MRPVWKSASVVLGMLTGAFTGCSEPMYGVIIPEYGAPLPGYDLSGLAVDAETEAVIPGIQVAFEGEAARTDEQGWWRLTADYPCDDCTLTADDVDGAANGTYAHVEIEHPVEETWADDIYIEMEPEP